MAAIVVLSPDEVAFCRTAAALALDPFDLTAEEEQLVLSFGGFSADDDEQLPPSGPQ